MSMTGRILALNTQAEELERRANNGDKKAGEGAAKAYEEATKLAEQHYGRLHEETLNLLEKWAYSVRNAGTLAQATSCHLQNVERTLENLQQCQRLNVPEDELVTAQKRHLDAQRQLAETYVQAEKFPEAIKLYEDILNSKVTRSDQELYEDGADLTSALYKSNLDGNIMRAAQLNTLMLRGADQKLGRSNVETVNIRFNLAKDLYSLGRYSEASARYAELLQILEAPDCMARLSPKYDYYLTGTKKSQDNCRNAIARIEEKARLRIEQKNRRTEEAMSDKGKQLVVRGSISQNENETHATASRAENTHDQNRSKEKLAQPAEKKDEHNRTTNMQSGSRAEQSKETPSHTNQADSSDMPVKHSVKDVSGPRNLHGAANQEGSDTRRKSTVEWIPDTNAHAWKEMRRHVPARPRSASATLNPHHAPEAPEKTVHRSNSTRSQTGRSDHGTTRSHILAGSTTWAAESKPKTQQNSSPSSSSHGKASQDTAGQGATTKPAEGRSVLSPQRQGETRQESDRKTEIKTRNGSASSQEPNNPGRPVCGYQSKQDQHILMRNRDCAVQSAERSQQSQPVPSILLSAPMHRNKPRSMSHVGAESDRQAIKEKERPKSSQANYPTGSSFLATAEKRDLTSRAKDVAQALMPSSKAANDSEGISKRIASVAESASKKNDAGEHRSQQSSRKYSGEPPERKNNTSGESSRSVGEAPKASKTMPMASGVEIQGQPRPVEAPKNAKATLPSNSGVKLQPSEPTQGQEQRQFDYTMSVTNPEKSTAVETAAPKGPVSAVNTKARRSGQTDLGIPGGSYRDLDEPDSNKTTRKARSNDTLSQGGLRISQSNEEGHRRAASVDVPRSLVPAQEASFAKDLSSAVEIRADNWFTELRNNAHRILEEYKDDCYDVDKTKRRVKIAVLDTGVARSSASGFVSPILKSSRVKLGKALDPSLPWNADSNGHGTHAVGLILTVCPYTDVYVYRVCQDSSYIDKNMVANAILDAVDRRKVDIISMSLGWENDSHDGLRQAVRHARASDVLIFAASSNEGVHSKMAFPARAPEVIAVDAASVYGRPLETNPRAANEKKSDRLTALGQAVGSTWPAALPSDDPQTGRKRLTGTSCATPILAGVAGLVLEFARQRPLCLEQGIEKQLKSVEGMRSVLKHLLCHKYESDTNFNILEPTKLFYVTERYPKGGPCDQPFSPRFLAAHRIVDVLRREY